MVNADMAGHTYAEVKLLLQDVRGILFCALHIRVFTFALLSKEARLVGSTRNVDLPSARLEANGDAWMAQYGATLASPVLRTILSFHTNFDTGHVSDEDVRVVAHAMTLHDRQCGFRTSGHLSLTLEGLF